MVREQIPVAKRAASIEYAIRDVVVPATKLESEGHEIIKLNIGDPIAYPGLPTPKHMVDAYVNALKSGNMDTLHHMVYQSYEHQLRRMSEGKVGRQDKTISMSVMV